MSRILSQEPVSRLIAKPPGRYFFGDATPASFVVQNPVVGVVKEQTHPAVAHGWVKLQVPPQVMVVNPFTPLRSCRAETVPAQRTAVMIAASNVFLIALPIIALL
jgi:hypothetical protein